VAATQDGDAWGTVIAMGNGDGQDMGVEPWSASLARTAEG
jgi:hypothetical protein